MYYIQLGTQSLSSSQFIETGRKAEVTEYLRAKYLTLDPAFVFLNNPVNEQQLQILLQSREQLLGAGGHLALPRHMARVRGWAGGSTGVTWGQLAMSSERLGRVQVSPGLLEMSGI